MWPKMDPPPWKNSTAGPGVAPSFVYQRIAIRAPPPAVAEYSRVLTSAGIGWAVPAAPMIGSHRARRAAMSPTAGGGASAIAPAIGASAAAISGSQLRDMTTAFRNGVGSGGGRDDDDDLAVHRPFGGPYVQPRQLLGVAADERDRGADLDAVHALTQRVDRARDIAAGSVRKRHRHGTAHGARSHTRVDGVERRRGDAEPDLSRSGSRLFHVLATPLIHITPGS